VKKQFITFGLSEDGEYMFELLPDIFADEAQTEIDGSVIQNVANLMLRVIMSFRHAIQKAQTEDGG
jgi:hypothetical protein